MKRYGCKKILVWVVLQRTSIKYTHGNKIFSIAVLTLCSRYSTKHSPNVPHRPSTSFAVPKYFYSPPSSSSPSSTGKSPAFCPVGCIASPFPFPPSSNSSSPLSFSGKRWFNPNSVQIRSEGSPKVVMEWRWGRERTGSEVARE